MPLSSLSRYTPLKPRIFWLGPVDGGSFLELAPCHFCSFTRLLQAREVLYLVSQFHCRTQSWGVRRGVILVCGIGGLSRRVPDSAGMATPGVPLVQLLKGIKSLGQKIYVSGMLAVLANKGLVSTLEHVGHFRLLCKLLVGFVVAIYIYIDISVNRHTARHGHYCLIILNHYKLL